MIIQVLLIYFSIAQIWRQTFNTHLDSNLTNRLSSQFVRYCRCSAVARNITGLLFRKLMDLKIRTQLQNN